jgi:cysteinyl-tRNA synthetase
MALVFYNTLMRMKQPFAPLREGEATIYTCGPTIYAPAQIGNLRAFVFYDLLVRVLRERGYRVRHVMNLTDVDDKTIRAAREAGVSLRAHTDRVAEVFFRDLDALRVVRAERYPRATEHVPQMVDLIRRLRDRGMTYESGGSTYFRISSFPAYGRLSGFRTDELKAGARVDADEYDKEGASDFVLWKAWKPEDGDVAWDTEIGRGRPGWHIECSAMSMAYLGETLDIHGGGVDLVFPHHENEIAQSEGATGKPFVRFWLHNGWLLSEGKKMSKSLKNYFVLSDIEARGFTGEDLRHFFHTNHYRQQFNFTWEGLSGAAAALSRLRDFYRRLGEADAPADEPGLDGLLESARERFDAALDDDLNAPEALGALHGLAGEVNKRLERGALSRAGGARVKALLDRFDRVLGFLPPRREEAPEAVRALAAEREQARARRDFAASDELRRRIRGLGYLVEDTPKGPRLKKA